MISSFIFTLSLSTCAYIKNNIHSVRIFFIHYDTEFNISTSPNILELRPGEEKYIQIKIQSKTNLDSFVFLPEVEHEKLEMSFTTDHMNILPLNTAITSLTINALPNAQPESFSIPVSTVINFPNKTEVTLGGEVSFSNTVSPQLREVTYFTVTILPELGFIQRLDLFVNSVITPISGLWTFLAGVAAVLAPLIIRLYRSRIKSDSEKSDVNANL